MSLTMSDDSNTTHVTSTDNHSKISCVKLDEINDLASLDLQHDSVMDCNQRVRIADSATIMGDKVWDTFGTSGYTSHLTKLVLQNKDSQLKPQPSNGELMYTAYSNICHIITALFNNIQALLNQQLPFSLPSVVLANLSGNRRSLQQGQRVM